MSYITVDEVSGHKLRGAQMGSIFSSIAKAVGLKSDSVQKYLDQGDSLQKIYADWKPDFAASVDTLSRIPTGSQKGTLTAQQNKIYGMTLQLEPAMAPGSTPGTADRATLSNFIDEVKSFRSAVNALATQYGVRPAAPGSVAFKPQGKASAGAGAGLMAASVGGIPLWIIGVGLFAYSKMGKKGKK